MTYRDDTKLVPLESTLLRVLMDLWTQGVKEGYGFQLSQEITARGGQLSNPGFSSIYRALDRMWKRGLLETRVELTEEAVDEDGRQRPARRYYSITPKGREAYETMPRLKTKVGHIPGLAGGYI